MPALFPFTPNWVDPVQETLAYNTEIISSRSRLEQRRAWRLSPRRTLQFRMTAFPVRHARYKAFMTAHRREEIGLPDPVRKVKTTTNVAAGNAVVSVAETRAWLVPGQLVAFSENGRAEMREIINVVGLVVTLDLPLNEAWAKGSNLRPVAVGRFADELSGTTPILSVWNGVIEFQVEPTSEADEQVPAAPVIWNNREVFLLKPNFATEPQVGYNQYRELLDYGFGQVRHVYPQEAVSRTYSATYQKRTLAEIEGLKNAFKRARGMARQFYMPTWERDVEVGQAYAAGTNVMAAPGTELASAYAASRMHRNLLFQGPGTLDYRHVAGLAAQGGQSVFTLVGGPNFVVDSGTSISWLMLTRFASDEMTVSWLTDTVAQTALSFTSLEDVS